MRISIKEPIIVISFNLRPYIGVLPDLGVKSTLNGQFVVEIFLHILTGLMPLLTSHSISKTLKKTSQRINFTQDI